MNWIYKDHIIMVTKEGDFKFKHKGKFYYAQTLASAKLAVDALCTSITINKYAIIDELTKIETEFNYVMHIIGRTCGFFNLNRPEVAEFRRYIQNLEKKYEETNK